jgi:hypothetical protein
MEHLIRQKPFTFARLLRSVKAFGLPQVIEVLLNSLWHVFRHEEEFLFHQLSVGALYDLLWLARRAGDDKLNSILLRLSSMSSDEARPSP